MSPDCLFSFGARFRIFCFAFSFFYLFDPKSGFLELHAVLRTVSVIRIFSVRKTTLHCSIMDQLPASVSRWWLRKGAKPFPEHGCVGEGRWMGNHGRAGGMLLYVITIIIIIIIITFIIIITMGAQRIKRNVSARLQQRAYLFRCNNPP